MGKNKEQAKVRKGKREPETITPEKVILSRLRRLADWEDVKSFLSKLVMMMLVIWVLFGQVFGITPMKNNDMSPSISAGDVLLYYRMQEKLRTDDIIVFEKDGRQYVGRIVGKEGETVEITEDSRLKVDDSIRAETNIFYSTPRYEDTVIYPVNLADDEYFILCDYREGARDSRYFGPVKRSEIKGKVITVLRRSSL